MVDRPRIYVGFNEMVEANVVLLSKLDEKRDSSGTIVLLTEGLRVHVYMDDDDEAGLSDPLVAEGVVERSPGTGWTATAKWCCRIDVRGVRSLSTLAVDSNDADSES